MADNYSILLVRLKTDVRTLVSSHFTGLGHQVIIAKDSIEAGKILNDQEIHVVYLQSSSDDKAVDELEELTRNFASLPVILICARRDGDLILKAWHAGATDVLFPPLTPQSLDASVRQAVKKMASHDLEHATAMQARFFYLDEAGNDCWVTITPPKFTIGRSSGNSLVLGQMGI